MPFTTQELADAGKAAIDFYLKNNPVDQIAEERPWLKKLMAGAKEFPGAKQYIIEQLRKDYGENFQWYYGSQNVSYNSRQTLEQAQFEWKGAHDGFFLDEDTLAQNGVTMTDDRGGGNTSGAERTQLNNLMEENAEALRLGFEQKFDYELHLNGTQSTEALEGLDKLVATDGVGTVGGIASSTEAWWQNNFSTSVSAANLLDTMETKWRECIKYAGSPDFIMAGGNFLDTYRQQIQAGGTYQLDPSGRQNYDSGVGLGSNTGLSFKGVPVIWNPIFETLQTNTSAVVDWNDRCYFINSKHIKLRPMQGHNMVTRKPPREYNRYVHYWALTWKGSLCTNKRRAHALIAL